VKTITATTARVHFGQIMTDLVTSQEPIVIEADGARVGVLVPLVQTNVNEPVDFVAAFWELQEATVRQIEIEHGGPLELGDVDALIDFGQR